jgi:hypothetical protein
MSILRVEQDQIEFFTESQNGACHMSETGLARLCGISQQGMYQLVTRTITSESDYECLKGFCGEHWRSKVTLMINGLPMNVNLIPSAFCAAIVEYLAFESPNKTAEALFAHRKFAKMGIEAWIQSITGWKPQIAPELTMEAVEAYANDFLPPGKLAVSIHPGEIIKLLQQSKFSADGYRLYLYLEMLALQEQTPTIDHICDTLNISMSTFKKWLPQVHEWSRCADWIEIRTRQGPEFAIQTRMHQELGGDIEVQTIAGRIDLVTAT